MAEIWKDVVGYEGLYQVSDRGRIKSICSYVRLQNGELMKKKPHILKLQDRCGYNGSKVDNYSQVVDSNLPKSFKLNIPLFKGFANEEIEVEIYADVDGRDVSLSLVSAGANEAIEEYKNKVIDEQLGVIRQIAPGIVIIEV